MNMAAKTQSLAMAEPIDASTNTAVPNIPTAVAVLSSI